MPREASVSAERAEACARKNGLRRRGGGFDGACARFGLRARQAGEHSVQRDDARHQNYDHATGENRVPENIRVGEAAADVEQNVKEHAGQDAARDRDHVIQRPAAERVRSEGQPV